MSPAYLISCSRTKACVSNYKSKLSNLDEIKGFPELRQARSEILSKLELQLDFEKCLPAWQMYRGRLFNQVEEKNWIKPDSRIFIMSALFGLIYHDDLIPWYNLRISNAVARQFWIEKNLLDCVDNTELVNLTFNDYHKVIFIGKDLSYKRPTVPWTDNYGSHRGKWLNQNLNLL